MGRRTVARDILASHCAERASIAPCSSWRRAIGLRPFRSHLSHFPSKGLGQRERTPPSQGLGVLIGRVACLLIIRPTSKSPPVFSPLPEALHSGRLIGRSARQSRRPEGCFPANLHPIESLPSCHFVGFFHSNPRRQAGLCPRAARQPPAWAAPNAKARRERSEEAAKAQPLDAGQGVPHWPPSCGLAGLGEASGKERSFPESFCRFH